MTQETGNQQTEKKPWESDWVPKAKQLVTETVDNVKKAVEGVKMPWEDTWKEKPKATPQQGVTEAPTPIKPIPTEAAMIKAAQLSPKEQAKDAAREKSAGNIAELKAEIAKTQDPKTKKVLEDYLKSLDVGTVTQKEIGAGSDKGDAKLKTLLDNASENSDFKTLYSFLKDKDSLPNMKVDSSLDSKGQFTYGEGEPAEGSITVWGSSKGFVSTLVHEMTHAADRQMVKLSSDIEKSIRKGEKVSKEEEQFLSNWKKSFGVRSIGEGGGEAVGLKSLMKSIADPKWLSENQDYRTTRAESIAHGVGNVNKKSSEIYNLQSHMDPSIATEFMILLNQANRIKKKRKE